MIDGDSSSIQIQSIFRLLIVSLLYQKSLSGYDLIKTLEEITGERPSAGSIYPFLHELLECGHIKVGDGCSKDGRGKKLYTLTTKGIKLLDEVYFQLKDFIEIYRATCPDCQWKYFDEHLNNTSKNQLID